MSGCAHCVWDDYRDDVEAWAEELRMAGHRGIMQSAGSSISMDDDGGGSETNWTGGGGEELFGGIPVGIREFMRTEKRLRDRMKKKAAN
jgi:hypothetical protein